VARMWSGNELQQRNKKKKIKVPTCYRLKQKSVNPFLGKQWCFLTTRYRGERLEDLEREILDTPGRKDP